MLHLGCCNSPRSASAEWFSQKNLTKLRMCSTYIYCLSIFLFCIFLSLLQTILKLLYTHFLHKCNFIKAKTGFWSKFILARIFQHSDWIRRDTKYSVRMRENADQNNSEYGNFLRIDWLRVAEHAPDSHFCTSSRSFILT